MTTNLLGSNNQAETLVSTDSQQRELCIILVDGAWKRNKQQHPRAEMPKSWL